MSRSATASSARPTALVTGASAGIGAALARSLARAGHRLVLVARREAALHELAASLQAEFGVAAEVMPADLADPQAPARLAAALAKRRRRVDVLVNNAGMLAPGRFVELDAAVHRDLVALNVAGLTAMLTAFVPPMAKRGAGRILNVASVAAFNPVPGLATYAATKAYVLSLTESLAEELRGSGVTATALCPGITATGMLERAVAAEARLAALPGFVVGEAQAVADEGVRACLAGEVVCVPGVVNAAAVMAARAAPKWLARRVAGEMSRRFV